MADTTTHELLVTTFATADALEEKMVDGRNFGGALVNVVVSNRSTGYLPQTTRFLADFYFIRYL
jgi:hypothetical protein